MKIEITELFTSLQGESTYTGLPCLFIRLTGCNLRCNWCDAKYSYTNGKFYTIPEIIIEAEKSFTKLVEITGGEPLLHKKEVVELSNQLIEKGYTVLLETNGSISLKSLPKQMIKIPDVKLPSSGEYGSFLMENLTYLTKDDELKFVIADELDYQEAKEFIQEHTIKAKILFSPAFNADFTLTKLADRILVDKLSVRLQTQLHKQIWGDVPGK